MERNNNDLVSDWLIFYLETPELETRSLLLPSTTGAPLSTESGKRQFHQFMFWPAISSPFELEG